MIWLKIGKYLLWPSYWAQNERAVIQTHSINSKWDVLSIRNSLAAAQNFLETYNRSQHVKEHLKIQMCLWSQEASWWGISATDAIMSLSWGTEYSGLFLFPSWVGWNIYYKQERSGVKCFTGKLEVADEWQTSVDPRLTSMTHITSVFSPS